MTVSPHKKWYTISVRLRLHWLLYLFVTISLAQADSKKLLYFDETWRSLTEIEYFEMADVRLNLPVKIENDTAIIARLIPRATYGIMQQETRLDLMGMLTTLSGRKFDQWTTVVLNFHFEEENSIQYYTSQKSLIRKMQRTISIEQFFITEKNYGYEKDNVGIYEDKFDGIRRLLFNDNFKGDNYAIIKPNGQYFRYYGEYDMSKIYDRATTDWSINYNDYHISKNSQNNKLPVKFTTAGSALADQASNSNDVSISGQNYRIIRTEDLVMINKNFKSRYPDLVTYYFHDNLKNFNEVRGDFLNVKVPRYKTLNIACSFWAKSGKHTNSLQVMLMLSGESDAEFNPYSIQVTSRIHGELHPAKINRLPTYGKYAVMIFQKEIKLSRPEEILEKIKNDIVTLYIDGAIYEFIAPEFD